MRTPPCWCLLLLSLAVATCGERIARGTVRARDGQGHNIGFRRLKKGANKEKDYYYAEAVHKPKGKSASSTSVKKTRAYSKPASPPRASSSKGPSRQSKDSSSSSTSDSTKHSKKKKSGYKMDKSRSSKEKQTRSSKGNKSGKGKDKDKGSSGNGDRPGDCSSPIANTIQNEFSQVITRNPDRCCNFKGPTTVYVTHALEDIGTPSGFEPFWDEMYSAIARLSNNEGLCFVMTGVDLSVETSNSLSEVLTGVNKFVSQLPDVVSMMSTDPTDSVDLMNEIRTISSERTLPSIGIFNAGYNNVIVESIVSGQGRIPYVGYLNDADYGGRAAQISLDLLSGVTAKPLCFNARLGELDFIGERCAAYYDEITKDTIEPAFGVACNADSTAMEIFDVLAAQEDVNAVWTHVDCCAAVAEAVEMLRRTGREIVVGCQDQDTSNNSGGVDFVTKQPVALQANSATSWANFPVVVTVQGKDGSGGQYFPGLDSLVNTEIFNEVIIF